MPTNRKSVIFGPLSPMSEMTMDRHHRDQAAAAAREEARQRAEQEAADKEHGLVPVPRQLRSSSSSSSSSDDSVGGRRRRVRGRSSSEDTIEILPDRFDRNGRRIDGESPTIGGWTSRSGSFVRQPQHRGDWNIRGAWHVASTDGEMVERLVRDMTGALEGRKSWMSVLGTVIGGIMAPERGAIKDRDRSKSDRFHDDQRMSRRERRRRR